MTTPTAPESAQPRLRLTITLVAQRSIMASPEAENDTAFAREARARAGYAPHAILLSGGAHPCSHRSLAALSPVMLLEIKDGAITLRDARGTAVRLGDPFDSIDTLLRAIETDGDADDVPLLAGYVAYEAGRYIETLPASVEDVLGLPDIYFLFPSIVLIHDREAGTIEEYSLAWSDGHGPMSPLEFEDVPRRSGQPRQTETRDVEPTARASDTKRSFSASEVAPFTRGFTRARYIEAVERVRAHIFDGDVYQVNLSQRFVVPLCDNPFTLWLRMFEANPAPFYAWVDAGTHQLLSASMERFFRIERGADGFDRIETRPIKGTRPRGSDEAETARLADELLRSAKDDAELSMIVDLERNDLGRICRAGSVRVAAHKIVERYGNVLHLVSIVEGKLEAGTGLAAVFRALFPGGSVTGCPKIRAMEIIDALEPETRHAYTGAIGYVTADGSADFNIAIRTAIAAGGKCRFSVGGGVVYESDPAEEHLETIHKGKTFFELTGIDAGLDHEE